MQAYDETQKHTLTLIIIIEILERHTLETSEALWSAYQARYYVFLSNSLTYF